MSEHVTPEVGLPSRSVLAQVATKGPLTIVHALVRAEVSDGRAPLSTLCTVNRVILVLSPMMSVQARG